MRIYPIQSNKAQPYEYLDRLLGDLESKGVSAEIVPVRFEFQRGSNRMLRMLR